MMTGIGGRKVVTGRSMARAAVSPIPGSTPTIGLGNRQRNRFGLEMRPTYSLPRDHFCAKDAADQSKKQISEKRVLRIIIEHWWQSQQQISKFGVQDARRVAAFPVR